MRSLPHLGRITLVLILLAWPAVCLAEKTDTVVLRNGDKITGEVKSLSRGKLDYSTDDVGRLSIEWVKIARIQSPHSFEVEEGSGTKHIGRLAFANLDGTMAVDGEASDTLSIPQIVQISELDAGFFQRVQAFLDLGATYAKANHATTFSSSGEVAYRGSEVGSKLSFDSYAQGQATAPTTSRNSGALQASRFLPKRWSAILMARAEQNDELNLKVRYTGAGLLGRTLRRSNSSGVGGAAGLAVTRERFAVTEADSSADDTANSSLEAVVAAQWDAFRFDSPKLDFSTTMYLYPSITDAGRVRGEFTTRLKYELVTDFNVGVSGTDTFDSHPPESATKNDFIMSFTIGWSYRR